MNKFLLISLTLGATLFALDIPIQKTQLHAFSKSVELNAKVIQLSNAQQSITSMVNGHLEKYFVKPAQSVRKGQKVALVESIIVSKMSADYISLKKQLNATSKNYEATKNLYEKGMTSMQELNNQSIKRSEINAQLTALESQLSTLSIDASSLKKATANFILYAHSDGKVSSLLKPLHSSVNQNDAVVAIVKEQAYYIEAYLPLEYSSKVKVGDKIVVTYAKKDIVTHITQILPKLDELTQRVVVLASVDEKVENLFINSYVGATLFFGDSREIVAVKKSALSFFKNEWVVFIPKEEHEDEHHDEEADYEEHGEHEEHDEAPYEIKVVEVIAEDESYVGVNGIELNHEYVSDKSYYVKSELLKSSLGGHGH